MRDQAIMEYFEQFEPPEGVRAELLRRSIVLSGGPDIVHNKIVTRVMNQFPRDEWARLQLQHVAIAGEPSYPRPDLVVMERGACEGDGWLVPASDVTMLLEVVSGSSVDRDYGLKRSVYAAGGIPAYLVIDPHDARCVLLTEPYGAGEDADYEVQRTVPFGKPIRIDALGIKLDTTQFGTLPAINRHRRP
ncbi:Uma2 family endonuclease [Streptomyces sp. NPDC001339]|uniref:Uma2 family endonuclease n=1 Tax=Streptomyces sp. NPDC001339 TaxID=3364563 RepID=UPI003678484A